MPDTVARKKRSDLKEKVKKMAHDAGLTLLDLHEKAGYKSYSGFRKALDEETISAPQLQTVYNLIEEKRMSSTLSTEPSTEYRVSSGQKNYMEAQDSKQKTSLGKVIPDRSIPAFKIELAKTNLMLNELLGSTPVAHVDAPGQEGAEFAFQVWGHCMYGRLSSGDWVTARRITDFDDLDYGSFYLIVTEENKRVRKVLKGSTPDTIKMICLNKSVDDEGNRNYPDLEIERSKIKGMALLLGKIERLKI